MKLKGQNYRGPSSWIQFQITTVIEVWLGCTRYLSLSIYTIQQRNQDFPSFPFLNIKSKQGLSASQSTSLTPWQAAGPWAEGCANCGWSWTTCSALHLSSTSSSSAMIVSCLSPEQWVEHPLLHDQKLRPKSLCFVQFTDQCTKGAHTKGLIFDSRGGGGSVLNCNSHENCSPFTVFNIGSDLESKPFHISSVLWREWLSICTVCCRIRCPLDCNCIMEKQEVICL